MFRRRVLCGIIALSMIINSLLPGVYNSSADELDIQEQVAVETEVETVTKDIEPQTEVFEEQTMEPQTEDATDEAVVDESADEPEDTSEIPSELEVSGEPKVESTPIFSDEYYNQYKDSDIYWRKSTANRYLYDENGKDYIGKRYYGETVEEVLSMLDDTSLDMTPLDEFFKDTVFAGSTRETLEYYADNGISFDMVINAKIAYLSEQLEVKESKSFLDYLTDFVRKNFTLESDAAINLEFYEGTAYKTGNKRSGNITGITADDWRFVAPAFGTTKNALLSYQTVNGAISFCADYGKTFRSGITSYGATGSGVPAYVAKAVNYYNANKGSISYAYDIAQMFIWAKGDEDTFVRGYRQYLATQDVSTPKYSYEEVAAWTDAELGSHVSNRYISEQIYDYYTAVNNSSSTCANLDIWSNGDSSWQRLYTTAQNIFEDEYAVDVYANGNNDNSKRYIFNQTVAVNKYSMNNESLSGAEFRVEAMLPNEFNMAENMENIKTIVTDSNGVGTTTFNLMTPRIQTNITFTDEKAFTYTYYGTDPHLGMSGEEYEDNYNQLYAELERLGEEDIEAKALALINATPIEYEITETKAPYGYVADSTPFTVTITGVDGNQTVTGNTDVYNDSVKTTFVINKVDNIFYDLIYPDAEFTLYEWDSAINDYKVSIDYEIRRFPGEVNGNGIFSEPTYAPVHIASGEKYIAYSQSNQGKFKVVETKAPEGFFGSWEDENTPTKREEYLLTITPDLADENKFLFLTNQGFVVIDTTDTNTEYSKGDVVFTNQEVKGILKFFKVDADANAYVTDNGNASLDGAIYDIYVAEDITTRNYDIIYNEDTGEETVGWSDSIRRDFETSLYYTDAIFDTIVSNKTPFDLISTFGNRFSYYPRDVYAEEIDEYMWTDTFYPYLYKDNIIASGVIKNGSFTVENLPIGKYYVKERCKEETAAGKISYAKGYLVDENRYDFEIKYTHDGYSTEVVTSSLDNEQYPLNVHVTNQNTISKDEIIKSGFTLTKLTQNTGETMMRPLAGAGFSIYKISDLSKIDEFTLDENGNYDIDSIIKAYENKEYSNTVLKYDFSNEEVAYTYENGVRVDFAEAFSDENGLVVVEGLPYGEYVVVETTIPEDVFVVDPFIVSVNENSPAMQSMRYLDDEGFEAYLKIVKVDAYTGKEILKANSAFEIIDKKTNEKIVMTDTILGGLTKTVDVFYTNEAGVLTLPELLPVGEYAIREVNAVDGYYNNTLVDGYESVFKVTTNRVYEAVGTDLSTNRDVIKITETYANTPTMGMLNLYKEGSVVTNLRTPDENNKNCFKFEKRYIPEAVFEIYADGDVLTQDNQGTVWFKDKEFVCTVTTGKNGEISEVFFAPKYTSEDEFLKVINDGTAGKVSVLLPLGNYTVKEVSAPNGYVLDTTEYKVGFEWNNQNEKYIEKDLIISNERQNFVIQLKKVDNNQRAVSGAKFKLYSDGIHNIDNDIIVMQGETICEAVSDENGIVTFDIGLPAANTLDNGKYYVQEIESAKGYILNDEVFEFEYIYSDQVSKTVTLSDTCVNEQTALIINKLDEAGNYVKNAKLRIRGGDGTVYDEWLTNDTYHVSECLPLNESLVLEEVEPAKGYVTAESIVFSLVEDNKQTAVKFSDGIQTSNSIDMIDDYTKLEISKKDIVNNKELAGAHLAIFDESGNEIVSWISGCDGVDAEGNVLPHRIDYIPIGNYVLKEIKPASGYGVADDINFSVLDMGDVQYITMYDTPLSVELRKLDGRNNNFLPGAEFIVTDKSNNVLETIETTDSAYTFKEIQYSTDSREYVYTLTEKKAPSGFVKAKDITFKIIAVLDENGGYETHVLVLENGEWIDTGLDYIEVVNEITRVEISKIDITTNDKIENAFLALYDMNGNEICSWISGDSVVSVGNHVSDFIKNEVKEKVTYKVGDDMIAEKDRTPKEVLPTYIEMLPVGTYILRELDAPSGYKVAKDLVIEIKNTDSIQEIVMYDTPLDSQIMLRKVDAANNEKYLEGAKFNIYADGKVVDTIVTNAEGYAVSKELPLARVTNGYFDGFIQYKIVEVESPEGYFLSGEEFYVTMEDGNSIYDLGDISNIKQGKTGFGFEDGGRFIKFTAPKTGDLTNAFLLIEIAIMAYFITIFLFGKKELFIETSRYGILKDELMISGDAAYKNTDTNKTSDKDLPEENNPNNSNKKLKHRLARFFLKHKFDEDIRGNARKRE